MNRILKIGSAFFVVLFITFNSYAQEANKNVIIKSSGFGTTMEEAKQAALRSAIEQAYGAFVSSNTEMFNDRVVADQMASVSNGNIKSFEIMNQDQLPNGRWGVTLKAIVSVDKLTSFVQAKGITIELKGGTFALNIKQQLLYEQGEIKAVAEMIGLLHEPMQISFDYVIKVGDPKSVDAESKNWEIPMLVTANCNRNIDFCANYFKKTLRALTLSLAEVETYKSLNKEVFTVKVTYNGQTNNYYLRKKTSISCIQSLISNWEAYTRLFEVQSGMDESYGNGNGELFHFSPSKRHNYYEIYESEVLINFPTNGQKVATFSWNDERTLAQIEQMTDYSVKPRGVISNFKNGGYVIYQKDGHGLVMSITDVGKEDYWISARSDCDDLELNGYNDWRLPSKEELESIYNNLYKTKMRCGIFSAEYWGCEISRGRAYYLSFENGETGDFDWFHNKVNFLQVRAVRSF
jgi:hypothetical protein